MILLSFKKSSSNLFVTYNVSVSKNGKTVLNDECGLYVFSDKSIFKSLNKQKYEVLLKEKIENAMQQGGQINFNANDSKMLTSFLPFTIVKDYRKNNALFIEEVEGQSFGYVKDTSLSRKWVLRNDTATIHGLKCLKAIYTIDSLLVTAWYCMDIPVSEGPFTYKGLPGLIVKAENSKGWYAEISSIEYKTTEKETVPFYTLTTEENLKKIKINSQKSLLGGKQNGINGEVDIKVTPNQN